MSRNVARVRVTSKWTGNSPNERLRAFKHLLTEFRRRVADAGIMHDYKEHQFFESKASKRRKKKRESELRRKQELLEERVLAGENVRAPAGMLKKKKKKEKRETNRG